MKGVNAFFLNLFNTLPLFDSEIETQAEKTWDQLEV